MCQLISHTQLKRHSATETMSGLSYVYGPLSRLESCPETQNLDDDTPCVSLPDLDGAVSLWRKVTIHFRVNEASSIE